MSQKTVHLLFLLNLELFLSLLWIVIGFLDLILSKDIKTGPNALFDEIMHLNIKSKKCKQIRYLSKKSNWLMIFGFCTYLMVYENTTQ